MTIDHDLDLAGIWAALENVQDHGAIVASATFVTAHGVITMASTRTGRVMTVDGERVPPKAAA